MGILNTNLLSITENGRDAEFTLETAHINLSLKLRSTRRLKVLVLFGTRPEVVKLAPIIHQLKLEKRDFQTIVVSSGQHADLLNPFINLFRLKIDYALSVMRRNQTPSSICAKILTLFDQVLKKENPDVVLVQGDTTTALAGAMAAFHRGIAVGHVEAGLRSGNAVSPFPEEMNRRLISQIATFHFVATQLNYETLIDEGVNARQIFVTGNPVVDAVQTILKKSVDKSEINKLLRETQKLKRILLTTHRRESFGKVMRENLRILQDFVAKREDTAIFFPVHPNPAVKQAVQTIFHKHPRIYLLNPLEYPDFIRLMANSWMVVSDSGGVQEEAPSLGKPLLILRENTERPEAIMAGAAKLVGNNPQKLLRLLEENYANDDWANSLKQIANPFGNGTAAAKIVEALSVNALPGFQTADHQNG